MHLDAYVYARACVCVRVQEMAHARVWIEGGGLGDAWHLDHVILTHLPSTRAWRFDCKDWVPKVGAGCGCGCYLEWLPCSDDHASPLLLQVHPWCCAPSDATRSGVVCPPPAGMRL